MTRPSLSLWKRSRAGFLALSLVCVWALAACGANGAGSDSASANATASSGTTGASTATTTGGGRSPTATPSSGSGTTGATPPPFFFTVRATASNSANDYTIIDNVVSNNNPDLVLFVTANWNPNGVGHTYDNHALGVFYISGSTNKWAIYHEDGAPYILDASYNVWVREPTQPGTFTWRANALNIGGDATIIDNPATNGNPNAVLLVTHNWNAHGTTGVYDNHPLGVYYIGGSTNKWAIYHQDLTAFPPNTSYNVYAAVANGTTKFVQRACVSPCAGDYITIDSPASNGKSNAIVFTTANWNPGGVGGVYDNHNLGVFYTSYYNKWAIFHQDVAGYIPNSSYNVMIPQPGD